MPVVGPRFSLPYVPNLTFWADLDADHTIPLPLRRPAPPDGPVLPLRRPQRGLETVRVNFIDLIEFLARQMSVARGYLMSRKTEVP